MALGCVRVISECFIKPKHVVEESKKPYHLGSFELFPLSLCYIQTGLAFNKLPTEEDGGVDVLLERLKQSLSSTLAHFYPLAGQLVTQVDEGEHNSLIYLDCNKGPGAKFVHAALDHVSINDIVSATKVPTIVGSLFELGRVPTNYDGHDEPLLSIQATELVDGFFIGISANHCVADGTVIWHLLSSWSEIFGSDAASISRPPSYHRWFPLGHGPVIKLPYTHPDEFITRYTKEKDDLLDEMVFHFPEESILLLKEKANKESEAMTNKISSVQALSALLWRAIARARGSQSDASTSMIMMANGRSRLQPPLPPHYFGNLIHPIITSMTVEELLGRSLGCVASFLHKGVEGLTDQVLRDEFVKWIKSPFIPRDGKLDSNSVLLGGVPRADLRNFEFGSIGHAVAIRTGSNKYNGRVMLRPGRQGRGSISVEVCLLPNAMSIFQNDPELLCFLSPSSSLPPI
ncbi:hypothetical protein V2J09_000085 [Rumex salicifolius]